MTISERIQQLKKETDKVRVKLVAVSKTKTPAEIMEVYETGHKIFGENTAQELMDKHEQLPKDIEWHFVGHLQSNKVKFIAPFIHLIHSVDSLKLLSEIDKQGMKNNRVIDCLLQVYIADEETKYGFQYDELISLLRSDEFRLMKHVRICGLMGIATNEAVPRQIREEFYELATLFKGLRQSFFKDQPSFSEISMGMSDDYKIAIEQGSTIIRLGSLIFGERNKPVKNPEVL